MANQMQCVVIIPVYKTELSVFEMISLKRCQQLFTSFNIVVIKPEKLTLPPQFSDNIETSSFDDSYFEDIHGYNKLMLSEQFYASFLDYKYLLIYQLDAFAFSDQLNFWCNQNYDYIGAPWIRERQFKSKYKFYKEEIKSYFHRRYNIIEKTGKPALDKQLANQVGNGGFSLRKTEVFYNVCLKNKAKIELYLQPRDAYFNEDIFFSIEINRKNNVIKIPTYQKAVAFAFETLPYQALKLNNNNLPFGCHAWEKNLDFWRPYFNDLGYQI